MSIIYDPITLIAKLYLVIIGLHSSIEPVHTTVHFGWKSQSAFPRVPYLGLKYKYCRGENEEVVYYCKSHLWVPLPPLYCPGIIHLCFKLFTRELSIRTDGNPFNTM